MVVPYFLRILLQKYKKSGIIPSIILYFIYNKPFLFPPDNVISRHIS